MIASKDITMGIKEYVLQRAKNEGIEIGVAKKNHDFVEVLLTETDFSVEKIANRVGVSISFVEDVKASLTLTTK